MSSKHLRILLSCHGWEDFPTHVTDEDAENLLACWSALWHPQLLKECRSVPSWHRVDSPPDDCAEFVFSVPRISREQLPTGFVQRVADQGGRLCQSSGNRDEIAQELVQSEYANEDRNPTAATFHALGLVYLLVQVLTRQYRYSSSLDDSQFERLLLKAIDLSDSGDEGAFNEAVTACFDLLSEERHRYFSSPIYLIDWTLCNDRTLGRLADHLESAPLNVHLDAGCRSILENQSDLANKIKSAANSGMLCLLGGEAQELRSTLLPVSSLIRQLEHGQVQFEKLGLSRPKVFARRRFGTHASYPSLINHFGFSGAVHPTMDDGQFPTQPDNVVRWNGFGNDEVMAIADTPQDASQASSFLQLPGLISQAIDRNSFAAITFVHWSGVASDWYNDLLTASRFGETIGKFVCLDQLFEMESENDLNQSWTAGDYHSPFHTQAIIQGEPDPVSRFIRFWTNYARFTSTLGINAMRAAYAKGGPQTTLVQSRVDQALWLNDQSTDSIQVGAELDAEKDLTEANQDFASVIVRDDANRNNEGFLIVNPLSNARRQLFEFEAPGLSCEQDKVIYCQEKVGSKLHAVVDVPGCGFVFVRPGTPQSSAKMLALIEDKLIRNEFFQVALDEKSGGIKSVTIYNQRGNLLSQQLAFKKSDQRRSRTGEGSEYSKMVADSLEVVEQNRVFAVYRSRGRLVLEDKTVGEFQQDVKLTRGIRVLDLDIEFDVKEKIRANPWNEYLCARMAWNDDSARVFRSLNESRDQVDGGKIESPLFVDVQGDAHRLTVFGDGIPYYRRHGYRMLDCILKPAGESRQKFTLGVGVDVKHPLGTAYHRLAPMQPEPISGAAAASGFIFHFSHRNVVPVHWKADAEDGQRGRTVLVLKETEGRDCEFKLTCPRNPKSARLQRLNGEDAETCRVEQDLIILKVQKYSLVQLVIDW